MPDLAKMNNDQQKNGQISQIVREFAFILKISCNYAKNLLDSKLKTAFLYLLIFMQ